MKTYFVQVEGIPEEEALENLRHGVMLSDGRGKTLPAEVEIAEDVWIEERTTPIRTRENIPTCWLKVRIHESRNRQIRKMVAHVGYPCLRLIRYSIGRWNINGMQIGESKELGLNDIILMRNLKARYIKKQARRYISTGKSDDEEEKSDEKQWLAG
jgi:23S rRNA pseudouridine2457 synthase